MSRQEIYNIRLAHSRLSGECQFETSLSRRAPQSRRRLPTGRSKSGFRMKPVLASKAR